MSGLFSDGQVLYGFLQCFQTGFRFIFVNLKMWYFQADFLWGFVFRVDFLWCFHTIFCGVFRRVFCGAFGWIFCGVLGGFLWCFLWRVFCGVFRQVFCGVFRRIFCGVFRRIFCGVFRRILLWCFQTNFLWSLQTDILWCSHGFSVFSNLFSVAFSDEFQRLTVCEDEQMEVWCKRSTRIAIYSAMFGRVPNGSAPCPPNKPGYIG